jgi:hypothetical protein
MTEQRAISPARRIALDERYSAWSIKLPSRRAASAIFALCAGAGAIGFVAALAMGDTNRAWGAYLVNFIFFYGIAQGGVTVAAAFYLTQGRWGGAGQYRLAEAFAGYLPAAFLLFWALYFGRTALWPWVAHPIAQKAAWLNTPFMFARDGLAIAALAMLSRAFVRASRRADVVAWAEDPNGIELPPPIIRRLAPAVGISYAAVFTLIAVDLVMSMSPMWHSTLFGVSFFATAFLNALCAMALTAVMGGAALEGGNRLAERRFLHDLGKLVFGFSIFWVYLIFCQFIVIWYGDIPTETFWVVPRVMRLPWGTLGWTCFALIWAIPFTVLMGAKPKQTPSILGSVVALSMAGIWLERYVLVTPSWSRFSIPFGWVDVAVTIGFFGVFGLCALPGLAMLPAAVHATEETGAS